MASKKDWTIAVIRVIVGIIFLTHGIQKLFMVGFEGVSEMFVNMGIPLAFTSAVIVSLVEFFGGILLILGLLTRWASIPLLIVMLVAFFAVHLPNGFFLPMGFEFVLALMAPLVGFIMAGPGTLSLGEKIWGRDI